MTRLDLWASRSMFRPETEMHTLAEFRAALLDMAVEKTPGVEPLLAQLCRVLNQNAFSTAEDAKLVAFDLIKCVESRLPKPSTGK